jgi:serine/threonine protein kinase
MELAPFTLEKTLKTTIPDYKYPFKVSQDRKLAVQEKLARAKTPILTNLMKLQIATDIAEGMNYLHTRDPPVIHADLKSPVLYLFIFV